MAAVTATNYSSSGNVEHFLRLWPETISEFMSNCCFRCDVSKELNTSYSLCNDMSELRCLLGDDSHWSTAILFPLKIRSIEWFLDAKYHDKFDLIKILNFYFIAPNSIVHILCNTLFNFWIKIWYCFQKATKCKAYDYAC